MATTNTGTPEAEEQIRELAAQLHAYRHYPCLLFVSRHLVHSDVAAVRAVLEEERGEHLDVIVASPGGDVEAGYLVARELRRRFKALTIFVPFRAKSAATVLCLAADELVLGSLGELGPLDQQYDEKQKADSPLSTSRLLPFKALQQLQHGATEMYDVVFAPAAQKPNWSVGQRLSCTGLPNNLTHAFQSWFLRVSAKTRYAERLLKRYRPALWAENGPKLLDRLVHAYPTHGFVIDREEAQELGLPTKVPDDQEATVLDRLALALIEFGTEQDLITMAGIPKAAVGAAQGVLDSMKCKEERVSGNPACARRARTTGRAAQ